MTLSFDQKRLLKATTAALLLHTSLFIFIDYYAPRLTFESAAPPVREMIFSLELPMDTPSPVMAKAAGREEGPDSENPEPIEPAPNKPEESVVAVLPPDEELLPKEATPEDVPADIPPEALEIPAVPQESIERDNTSEAFAEAPARSLPLSKPAVPGPGPSPGPMESEAPLDVAAIPVSFRTLSAGRRLSAPSYPAQAKRFKLEGTVKVSIRVSAEGKILWVELYESSGHGILDREVISTIKESWSFNAPGRLVTLRKNFTFKLQ